MLSRRGLLRGLLALPVVATATNIVGKVAAAVRWHRFRVNTAVVIPQEDLSERDKQAVRDLANRSPVVWTYKDPVTGQEDRIEISFGA